GLTNGCSSPAYLPNASCTITLAFAPVTTGPHSATIAITSDAATSPQTIALDGAAGAAFTVGPANAGSLSATITAGQTATYNLQILAATNFAGNISFACSGAPPASTCGVPPALPINGNAVPFTVRVATTGTGAAAGDVAVDSIRPHSDRPRLAPFDSVPALSVMALLGVVAVLLWIYVALRANAVGGGRKLIYSASFATLLAMVSLNAAGCGG